MKRFKVSVIHLRFLRRREYNMLTKLLRRLMDAGQPRLIRLCLLLWQQLIKPAKLNGLTFNSPWNVLKTAAFQTTTSLANLQIKTTVATHVRTLSHHTACAMSSLISQDGSNSVQDPMVTSTTANPPDQSRPDATGAAEKASTAAQNDTYLTESEGRDTPGSSILSEPDHNDGAQTTNAVLDESDGNDKSDSETDESAGSSDKQESDEDEIENLAEKYASLPVNNINEEGDLYLVVGPSPTAKVRVMAAAVKQHSAVFKTMINGPWKESQKPKGVGDDWVIRLPEDNEDAMVLILAVMHNRTDLLVPLQDHKAMTKDSTRKFLAFLEMADKYHAEKVMYPWDGMWRHAIGMRLYTKAVDQEDGTRQIVEGIGEPDEFTTEDYLRIFAFDVSIQFGKGVEHSLKVLAHRMHHDSEGVLKTPEGDELRECFFHGLDAKAAQGGLLSFPSNGSPRSSP
jgi:hypothetical protein